MVESLPLIAVIELGSQYTLLIERTIRELGMRSVILDPKRAARWLDTHPVKAIILSGGAASVYEECAPQPPDSLFALRHCGRQVPILGICYGMQWITRHLAGTVTSVLTKREYGDAEISIINESPLFEGVAWSQRVWASHGDSITELPPRFIATAVSHQGGIAAMENFERTIFGVQFHPEVTHTLEGGQILRNFLVTVAACEQDWEASSVVAEIQQSLRDSLGPNERVVFGFSGGVDSTVLAAIAAPVLGERLLAVTINGGHLRENELEEIERHALAAGARLFVVDARAQFERVMVDTIDAEEKRRRFKGIYTTLLREAAVDFGATTIFQGTLAPDRIESGATGGALIKSHHNIGLDFAGLRQAHPLDHLFKYEVRALARSLGLPESVWARQPFPGPGLFLRVNGTPATHDKLEIVRWAEARVREILERRGIYHTLSQMIVHLLGVKMVGVKGDARVYAYPVVVRAIRTTDFMTADGVHFDDDTEGEISTTLTRHPEIVCVMFNPTNKPPATTEPE